MISYCIFYKNTKKKQKKIRTRVLYLSCGEICFRSRTKNIENYAGKFKSCGESCGKRKGEEFGTKRKKIKVGVVRYIYYITAYLLLDKMIRYEL